MALSARELLLIVRAQNQASSVLRRVGSDISGLGRKEQLAASRQTLGIQRQRLLNRQASIRNQLEKEANGSSAIRRQQQMESLARQRATIENQINQGMTSRARNLRTTYEAETRQMRLEDRRKRLLSEMNRANAQIGVNKRAMAHPAIDENLRQTLARQNATLARTSQAAGHQLTLTNRDIRGNQMQLRNLGNAYRDVSNKVRGYVSSLRGTRTEQAKLTALDAESAGRRAELKSNLLANAQALEQNASKMRDLDKAEQSFKTERLASGVHLLGSMGRQLQLIGGVGAAALGFAANSAAQLNSEATLAATQSANTVQKVGVEAQKNMDAIISQMQEFPNASADMSSALYDIFSTLNVNGKQGRDILVQVNKAAVAGSLSVKDATTGVLSVLSNFKEIPQTAAGVATALNRSFAAVRFGRMTMQEFSTSLQTTAPAANQAGQSFNSLAGNVAFLSRSLGSSKASVGYARLLQQLFSTKMVAGLKAHGIAVRDAAGNYRDLGAIIDDIARKFPKLTTGQQSAQNFFKSLSGATGTIQASRAFTSIITNLSGYHNITAKTINDNQEFQKSFEAMNKTAGVEWARALNVVKSLWIELGQAALSTIGQLLKPLEAIARTLQTMDQSTKNSIGRFLVLAVAVSGLTGVVLSAVAALGGMVLIFGALEAGPILAVTGIIIGIAAAVVLVIRNWDSIRPRLIAYWPAIASAVKAAATTIMTILEGMAMMVEGVIGIIDAALRGDWGDLWNSASKAVEGFGKVFSSVINIVKALFTGWLNLAVSGWQGFIAATAIAVVTIVKVSSALREMAAAYRAVAVAQAVGGVAGAAEGGLLAGLGGGAARGIAAARSALASLAIGFVSLVTAESLAEAATIAFGGALIGPVGIAVAVTAAVAGLYLLWKAFGDGPSATQKALDGLKSAKDGFKDVATSLHDARDAQLSLSQAKLDLRAENSTIADYKKQVDNAKVGTDAYRTAEENLNQAQLQRQSTIADIDRAQSALNQTLGKSAGLAQKADRGLAEFVANRASLQLAHQTAVTHAAAVGSGVGASRAASTGVTNAARQVTQTAADVAKAKADFADLVNNINDAAQALNQFAAAGGNISKGTAADNVHRIADAMSMVLTGSHDATAGIESFAQVLGRIPNQQEIIFQSNLKQDIIPGVTMFERIMHQVPSRKVTRFISNHKQIQLGIGALIATTGKMPTRKQMHFLAEHSNYDAGIAHYLQKYHRLPGKKALKLIVQSADAESKLDNARKKLMQLEHQKSMLTRMGHADHMNIDTSQVDQKIQAAKQKVQQLDDQVGKKRTKNFDIVFHPDASTAISNANALGVSLGTGIVTGLNSQIGAAAAAGAAVANAAIAGGASAKGAHTGSPSKKSRDKIGKPIAQGIINGMTDEMRKHWTRVAASVQQLILKGVDLSGSAKEKGKQIADAYNQAMDTAISTLKDKWNEIHDLNQQNFGELFQSDAIQTKIDWGAALNIGDLQDDLNKQLSTFRTFNSSLTRLHRRGGPQSLIDQLRQLGPSAQGELNALNGATRSQLQRYERTWKRSQSAINRATKAQFKTQIREWRNQGKAIAAGILMGLRDSGPQLQRYFRHIWQNLIRQTKHHNKSHSPSMLYAEEGENIVNGVKLGMERASRGMRVPMPMLGAGGGRGRGGTIIYQTNHFTHSDVSIETKLAKSNFRLRHRSP